MTDEPLPQGQTGVAPYDPKMFQECMDSCGTYSCGFNLFLINWTWSACPSVPISQKSAGNLERADSRARCS